MKYTSTRSLCSVFSAEAIARGLAGDGGLFVPENFPSITPAMLEKWAAQDYQERACGVLSCFLTDYTENELRESIRGAYSGNFDNDVPAPLHEIDPQTHFLELWHGPTCAFKDMALQLLPYLLVRAAQKTGPGKKIVILVATSGDTGKAALAGFADVPGTQIIVFFPSDGVSPMQKLQMTTQKGKNVSVCAIKGNFDDAQSGVKMIFSDPEMKNCLHELKMEFSSANSINFGRLVPQIVYYVSAYCDLLKAGKLKAGEKFNVAVPTGNFGNILAAYYAKKMGLPVGRLICCSNQNNILTDFLATGIYDRNRPFYCTTSPSMDILISSNLERLLYELFDHDTREVAARMDQLKTAGKYQIPKEILEKMQQEFTGGFCDEKQNAAEIARLFREYHYLCDPHTAVASAVLQEYRRRSGDKTVTVVASTASPYKFAKPVLAALGTESAPDRDEIALLQQLSDLTGTEVPAPLAALKDCTVLHKSCIGKAAMAEFIKASLA